MGGLGDGIDIHTPPSIKWMTSENLLCSAGDSAQRSPKWEGNTKEEGPYVYIWLIPFAVQQRLPSSVMQLYTHKN